MALHSVIDLKGDELDFNQLIQIQGGDKFFFMKSEKSEHEFC